MKFAAILPFLFVSTAVQAAPPDAATVAEVRAELEALRKVQAETNARIERLEATLGASTDTVVATKAAPEPLVIASAKPAQLVAISDSKLDVSGDVRLRYESNFGSNAVRNRDRWVLRARLRGTYAVTGWLKAGAQLTTGDPDDPNSSDVTLSNFDDDLQVSLDQAYLTATFGGLQLSGGKFVLPFTRTDLVWDGDIYPEGVSASFKHPLSSASSVRASGLYFVIDESIGGKDSRMIGGQLGATIRPSPSLELALSAAYYDYRLSSVLGGDAGDFRSNLFAGGRYLSDFNLIDIIGSASWSDAGKSWPIKLTFDYVKNTGAAVSADTAFSIDAMIGKTGAKGDWRFGYGYAQADVDAIFAAFSNDNIVLATNYIQHSVAVVYTLAPHVILNGTVYRYRPKASIYAGALDPDDWINRVRINLLAEF